ncbi:NUDIX hydrolase [Facklamia miroungae]|uniref:hypothetical protein n=1 Tax=Facklamia miroungae TaxID=120956 RepID=UPI000B138344|nr:hypothetical protein [Facklamia miroungae]NKZ29762.1 hypothetical protein [Facklamia miroungae]
MTKVELENFYLSTLKLSYLDAVKEYEKCIHTKLGKLIANRELPILHQAKKILDTMLHSLV